MNPAEIILWLELGTRITEMIIGMFPAGTNPQTIIDKITEAQAEGEILNADWLNLMKKGE